MLWLDYRLLKSILQDIKPLEDGYYESVENKIFDSHIMGLV